MQKLRGQLISKIIILFIVFLLSCGDTVLFSQEEGESSLLTALYYFRLGKHETALSMGEELLKNEEEHSPQFRAKIYLLLGACLEKLFKPREAVQYYEKLKKLIEQESIPRVPQLPGLDPNSLTEYRAAFGRAGFFTHKEPVPVEEVLSLDRVVHAPRKSIRTLGKKKFNIGRAITSVVVVVGVYALVRIFSKVKVEGLEFTPMQWVHIPAGPFAMGDNYGEGQADEIPVHEVYLDDYHISRFEISIGQYNYFCQVTGRIGIDSSYPARNPGDAPLEYPVGNITWEEADAFCKWMSAQSGRNIHLPTEAQWEKAARGTDLRRYPWGNAPPNCNRAAYYGCGSSDDPQGIIRNLGYFETGVSPYGLFDMAGNVAEWCQDWYSSTYYGESPLKNPQGPGSGTYRVVRGGGIYNAPQDIRSANRLFYKPGYKGEGLGFRVVMESN